MKLLLLALFLSCSLEDAQASAKKHTGASSLPTHMSSGELMSCMEDAIVGRADGDCANNGESDHCVGMKRALEDSNKKTKCFQSEGAACLLYGYKQNSQDQWISVAAGHLALFHECLKKAYGEGRSDLASDDVILSTLSKIDDGSAELGLIQGEVLERTLKGESFGDILARSPMGKKLSLQERYALQTAADTPFPVKNPSNKELSADNEHSGTNPFMEGDRLSKARDYFTANATAVNPGVQHLDLRKKVAPAAHQDLANKQESRALSTSGALSIDASVYKREIKYNPYSLGLDRNLFERVSAVYQKKATELVGMDFYIPKGNAKPRDVKDMLKNSYRRPIDI